MNPVWACSPTSYPNCCHINCSVDVFAIASSTPFGKTFDEMRLDPLPAPVASFRERDTGQLSYQYGCVVRSQLGRIASKDRCKTGQLTVCKRFMPAIFLQHRFHGLASAWHVIKKNQRTTSYSIWRSTSTANLQSAERQLRRHGRDFIDFLSYCKVHKIVIRGNKKVLFITEVDISQGNNLIIACY